MNTITFIRHAQSLANINTVSPKRISVTLSPRGKEQAEEFIPEKSYKKTISSHYTRCIETALPISKKLNIEEITIWFCLKEFDFISPRRHENISSHQRSLIDNDYWIQRDPDHIECNGCESFSAFYERIKRLLEMLSVLKNEELLIITHAHVIRMILFIEKTLDKELQEININNNKKTIMKKYYEFLIDRSIDITNMSTYDLSQIITSNKSNTAD